MTIAVQFIEQDTNGRRLAERHLELPRETMTAFDLIRERVYQHINDEAQQQAAFRRSVFEPEMTETTLNDHSSSPGVMQHWQRHLDHAVMAFESGYILLFVDGQQIHSLVESVTVSTTSTITFVKLVPLVGG